MSMTTNNGWDYEQQFNRAKNLALSCEFAKLSKLLKATPNPEIAFSLVMGLATGAVPENPHIAAPLLAALKPELPQAYFEAVQINVGIHFYAALRATLEKTDDTGAVRSDMAGFLALADSALGNEHLESFVALARNNFSHLFTSPAPLTRPSIKRSGTARTLHS